MTLMAELPFYKYLDFNLFLIISAEDALTRVKLGLEAFNAKK